MSERRDFLRLSRATVIRNVFLIVAFVAIWIFAVLVGPLAEIGDLRGILEDRLSRGVFFWSPNTEFLSLLVANCTGGLIIGMIAYPVFDSPRKLGWVAATVSATAAPGIVLVSMSSRGFGFSETLGVVIPALTVL